MSPLVYDMDSTPTLGGSTLLYLYFTGQEVTLDGQGLIPNNKCNTHVTYILSYALPFLYPRKTFSML